MTKRERLERIDQEMYRRQAEKDPEYLVQYSRQPHYKATTPIQPGSPVKHGYRRQREYESSFSRSPERESSLEYEMKEPLYLSRKYKKAFATPNRFDPIKEMKLAASSKPAYSRRVRDFSSSSEESFGDRFKQYKKRQALQNKKVVAKVSYYVYDKKPGVRLANRAMSAVPSKTRF